MPPQGRERLHTVGLGAPARARADRVGLRGSAQVRRNAHVEILPLSTGCLGACTYCKTRHARGALGSYALPALVGRARGALADPRARPRAARPGRPVGERGRRCCDRLRQRTVHLQAAHTTECPPMARRTAAQERELSPSRVACVRGALSLSAAQVRELWLSSEDTGAYGRDLGTPLPQLLTALETALADAPAAPDGGPRVMMRLRMTNPPFMLDALDDVAAALNYPAVFAYLHVPVQSGSDAVLARMRREYTVPTPVLTLPLLPRPPRPRLLLPCVLGVASRRPSAHSANPGSRMQPLTHPLRPSSPGWLWQALGRSPSE